ncbi:MAG: NAD(P)H-hydrate dehydratase [Thermoplasmata archaeon]
MIRVLESKVLDRNAQALGISAGELMENAGKAVAREALAMKAEGPVLIACGPGNNGGDGVVAARHIARAGRAATIALLTSRKSVKSQLLVENLYKLPKSVMVVEEAKPSMITGAAIVIDSMLGTGLRSEPREPYASWIRAINGSGAHVISADVPTGLGTGLCVKPEITVTFHDSKEGMDRKSCGRIVIADIGIPGEAGEFVGPGELEYYPIPAKDSHKGQNGRLLIIGGGPYAGAPALSAFAAHAIGADLVTIAAPEPSASTIASYSPNFIVRPLEGKVLAPGHHAHLMELAGESDAVLLGPGLGRDRDTVKAVRGILKALKKPVVVDADGLFAMSGAKLPGFKVPAILTPHAREFTRLGGSDDLSVESADALAGRFNATILLKQPMDIISDGKHHKLNRTGNPGMTVGGTGDVLAGIVAGLMAKGAQPYDAARMGAYISGTAGDLAFDSLMYSMTATDVIACIPAALKRGLSKL